MLGNTVVSRVSGNVTLVRALILHKYITEVNVKVGCSRYAHKSTLFPPQNYPSKCDLVSYYASLLTSEL